MVTTLTARIVNEVMVASMVGFGGSLKSWFCVVEFGRNLASVALKMFSHLIYVL
jgi:hypothetical protein